MRPAKIDEKQPAIVVALRKVGHHVLSLAAIGKGCPDILVCTRTGSLLMIEIKSTKATTHRKSGELTPDQVAFHEQWSRASIFIVETVEEAIAAAESQCR